VSPVNPLQRRAVELLGDGQWRDFETVVAELSKLVPPGQAVRKSEKIRRAAKGAPEQRKKTRDAERLIASGARTFAREALRESNGFEQRVDPFDGARLVRMRKMPKRVAYALRVEGNTTAARALVDELLDSDASARAVKRRLDPLPHDVLVSVAALLVERARR
jgi:hypothetical protein